jgi:hypothetical protein
MCDSFELFESPFGIAALALPVAPRRIIAGWGSLRSVMCKTMPSEFSRDEWAYLISFLDPDSLGAPFLEAFGEPVDSGRVSRLVRPRGVVAVWLPNNVSLLGPLTLILLSLTGNRILLKGGSRSQDLTGAFLAFARRNFADGPLRDYLAHKVHHKVFAHGDDGQREMLERADVRIVFGSDEAAAAIHGTAPALRGDGFSFIDRQSQAWIEAGADSDDVLRNLIRVFATYGQVGCTSPRRVVLLNGTRSEAGSLRSRMIELWPEVLRLRPPIHVASANTMAAQWAAAQGWDVEMTAHRHAAIGVGEINLETIGSPMFLAISPATVEEAVACLPSNIQTLGHAYLDANDPRWLRVIAGTSVKRLVPIAHMHHFGPLWDGRRFWSQCFEEVEIQL